MRQDCLVSNNPAIAANPASVIAGQRIRIPASCSLSSSAAVAPASGSSGKPQYSRISKHAQTPRLVLCYLTWVCYQKRSMHERTLPLNCSSFSQFRCIPRLQRRLDMPWVSWAGLAAIKAGAWLQHWEQLLGQAICTLCQTEHVCWDVDIMGAAERSRVSELLMAHAACCTVLTW